MRNAQTLDGCSASVAPVPSIPGIQKTLVGIGDKPNSFQGSRQWIGSVEVAMVIDQLYGVGFNIGSPGKTCTV